MGTDASLYEVTDDSGFLGLLDPDAYVGFVGADWTLPRLLAHLRTQMRERRLLLWGTGREDTWRVRIEVQAAPPRGFREVSGPIVSSRGRLLLTNWEAVTMAATYADAPLPEPHEQELIVAVPPGAYRCTIVQLLDPEAERGDEHYLERRADFVITLGRDDGQGGGWSEVPWAEL
ncbi:MAG TPA: hypothetical protein VNA89_05290 [Gemmatimonadaceae bacterium]|nr:hypothetical protein [Gemmatimonadaceae bacterium]